MLMFILPPIAYLRYYWSSTSKPMRVACIALAVFGVATLVVTTVFTVIAIVQKFEGVSGVVAGCNATLNITIG